MHIWHSDLQFEMIDEKVYLSIKREYVIMSVCVHLEEKFSVLESKKIFSERRSKKYYLSMPFEYSNICLL